MYGKMPLASEKNHLRDFWQNANAQHDNDAWLRNTTLLVTQNPPLIKWNSERIIPTLEEEVEVEEKMIKAQNDKNSRRNCESKYHQGNPLDANQVVEGQEMSRKTLM